MSRPKSGLTSFGDAPTTPKEESGGFFSRALVMVFVLFYLTAEQADCQSEESNFVHSIPRSLSCCEHTSITLRQFSLYTSPSHLDPYSAAHETANRGSRIAASQWCI